MSEPDFDGEMLKSVLHTYNMDGNFLARHGIYIEGMLEKLDDPYSNEKLDQEQVHMLRVRILHTFIRRTYERGRNDGLLTACSRLNSTITGGYKLKR